MQVKTTTLLGLLVVLVIVAGLLLSLSHIAQQQRVLSISSYDECAQAGYPIMESYPEQCRTPDGRTFVNENATPVESPTGSMPINYVGPGCAVGGCSAQVCGEEGEDLVSTCEYRPEYGCYKANSRCERQATGKCGWTPTPQLAQCLAHPPQDDTALPQAY